MIKNCRKCGAEFTPTDWQIRKRYWVCRPCEYERKNGKPKTSRTREYHGMTYTPEFASWIALKTRCLHKKGTYYQRVTIHPSWIDSFATFIRDVGRAPGEGYTIDRIDNSKGYEPGNCRWATRVEQQRNRSVSVFYEYNGRKQLLSEWAKEIGVSYTTMHRRYKEGLPPERLLSPSRLGRPNKNNEQLYAAMSGFLSECG